MLRKSFLNTCLVLSFSSCWLNASHSTNSTDLESLGGNPRSTQSSSQVVVLPSSQDTEAQGVDYISDPAYCSDICLKTIASYIVRAPERSLPLLSANKRLHNFAKSPSFHIFLNGALKERFLTSMAPKLVFLYDNRSEIHNSKNYFSEVDHPSFTPLDVESKKDYFANVLVSYCKDLPYQIKLRIINTTHMFAEGWFANLVQRGGQVTLDHPRCINRYNQFSFTGNEYWTFDRSPMMFIPTDSSIVKLPELSVTIPFPLELSILEAHKDHLVCLDIEPASGFQIENLDLSEFPALSLLKMPKCGIKTIKFFVKPQNIFSDIDLSYNKLKQFPFPSTGKVYRLNLSHNRLKGKMNLAGFSEKLWKLNLYNNHITHVMNVTSTALNEVDISGNPLVALSLPKSSSKIEIKFPMIRGLCMFSSTLPFGVGEKVDPMLCGERFELSPIDMPEDLMEEFQAAFAQEKKQLDFLQNSQTQQTLPDARGRRIHGVKETKYKPIKGVAESWD